MAECIAKARIENPVERGGVGGTRIAVRDHEENPGGAGQSGEWRPITLNNMPI